MAVEKRADGSTSAGGAAPLKGEELENYGVWVKLEPQDLAEDSQSETGPGDAFNPQIPELREETFLTEEEESILQTPGSPSLEVDFSVDDLPALEDANESAGAAEPASDDFEIPEAVDAGEESETLAAADLDAVASFASPGMEEPSPAVDMDIPEDIESIEESETLDASDLDAVAGFAVEEAASPSEDFEEIGAEAFETPADEGSAVPSEAGAPVFMSLDEPDEFSIPEIEEDVGAQESAPGGDELPDISLIGQGAEEGFQVEPMPAPESGETEISLEEFGIDAGSPEPAASGGGSEELSLDDFLDSSDFGITDKREIEAREALSQEPIDLDLEFDDDSEFETLSISKDSDEELESVQRSAEAEPEERGSHDEDIETELVTDFDDILAKDDGVTALGVLETGEARGAGSGLDLAAGIEDSGLVEDAGIEDQTALVTEIGAEHLDIEMDSNVSERDISADLERYAGASSEADQLLASIDGLEPGDESPAVELPSREPSTASMPEAPGAYTDASVEEDADSGFSETIPFEEPVLEDLALDIEAEDAAASADGVDRAVQAGREPGTEGFDDLAAVERELAGEEEDVPDQRVDAAMPASLLHQIAEELSDIKRELSSLKEQLSSLRAGVSEARPEAVEEGAKPSGFFDEEEDETIALTGDELDNILNTADFTEETGASDEALQGASETSTGESADADAGDISLDLGEEDIIPLEEPSPQPQPSPQRLEPSSGADDRGLSDLRRIEEEGLSPMTEAPEDTSYLEEPIKDELEGAVLPETPLEEPDLSGFTVEEELVEEEIPVIDAGDQEIDLPVTEEEELELDDITLDLNPDSSVVPDVAAPAPTPSEPALDDGLVTEISLADETSPEEPSYSASQPAAASPDVLPKVTAAPPPRAAPESLKSDIRSVLQYMDKLLESLPEDKIEEFARSEHFSVYKRLFEELGLV